MTHAFDHPSPRPAAAPAADDLMRRTDASGLAPLRLRCTDAFDRLAHCGLRDGLPAWGQFCIDKQLGAALRGDVKRGLLFVGRGALPFGAQIRSVHDLMLKLLGGDPDLLRIDGGVAAACDA